MLTFGERYLIELPRNVNGTTPDFDVEFKHDFVSFAAIISGPSAICGQTVYTIANIPAASNVRWYNDENITYVSGQNTHRYTVRNNTFGRGNIYAEVSTPCGNATLVKNVRLGAFALSEFPIYGPREMCNGDNAHYYTNLLEGVTRYQWYFPGGWYASPQSETSANLYVTASSYGSSTPSSGNVILQVSNACGFSSYHQSVFVTVTNCGQYSLMLTPNPVASQLTVELSDAENTNNVNIDKVQLLNSDGSFVKEGDSATASKKIQLDTQGLPKGLYYVKVFIAGEVSTTRILIE